MFLGFESHDVQIGKRSKDPEVEHMYLANFHSHKIYLSEVILILSIFGNFFSKLECGVCLFLWFLNQLQESLNLFWSGESFISNFESGYFLKVRFFFLFPCFFHIMSSSLNCLTKKFNIRFFFKKCMEVSFLIGRCTLL